MSLLGHVNPAFHGRIVLKWLRDWRHAYGLTQRELAARAGITQPTVWRAERGDAVYASTVRRIAQALHVRPEDLLCRPEVTAF